MRKRDRLFALWAAQADDLVALTNAMRFQLEEPILEATPDEREELLPWLASTSSATARQLLSGFAPAQTPLAREDTLVRLATRAAIEVFAGLGLVLLWEWVTQRDARVCSRCGPLDGRIMQSHLVAPLPLHPRCRCGIRPVVKNA